MLPKQRTSIVVACMLLNTLHAADTTTEGMYLWINRDPAERAKIDEQEAERCQSSFPLLQKLPQALLEYVTTYGIHQLMNKGEFKAWHSLCLVNKQCHHVITQLMDRALASTGEYGTFKQLMRMCEIITEITGKSFSCDAELWAHLNPKHLQTRSGLFVECESSFYSIYSRWGHFLLPTENTVETNLITELLHTFLKRVSTTFYSIHLRSNTGVRYYCHDTTSWQIGDHLHAPTKQIAISATTLPLYQGKKVLIEDNCLGTSQLMVRTIDGEPVEEAVYREHDDYRSISLTEKLWDKLLARYKKEKALSPQ